MSPVHIGLTCVRWCPLLTAWRDIKHTEENVSLPRICFHLVAATCLCLLPAEVVPRAVHGPGLLGLSYLLLPQSHQWCHIVRPKGQISVFLLPGFGTIWPSWTLWFETLSYLGFCNTKLFWFPSNLSGRFLTSFLRQLLPTFSKWKSCRPRLRLQSFPGHPIRPEAWNAIWRWTTAHSSLQSWPLSWVLDSNRLLSPWYL